MNAFTADVVAKKRKPVSGKPKISRSISRIGRVIYLIGQWLINRKEMKK